MKSKHIQLIQTCNFAPEQYEAFYKGRQVGYLRLRGGQFTVECPDSMEDLVLCLHPEGQNCFEEHEREYHLEEARRAIVRWHGRFKNPTIWEKVVSFTKRIFSKPKKGGQNVQVHNRNTYRQN